MNNESIGERYHEFTKHKRRFGKAGVKYTPLSVLATLPLPKPSPRGGMPIFETIAKRRSIREYSNKPLSMEELSQLLWAMSGVTGEIYGFPLRAAPSAGALYPNDIYAVVNRVSELKRGIYRYAPEAHALELLREGDFSEKIAAAALDQDFAAIAAVVFVFVAVVERSRRKYRERAYRYIYMDAGYICENLYLAATALNLGCCAIGACYDDEVNALLGIDGVQETAVLLATVGKV